MQESKRTPSLPINASVLWLLILGLLPALPTWAGIQITVMPLGDSITAGVDITDKVGTGGYRRELQRLMGRAGIPTNFLGNNGGVGDPSVPDRDHQGYPGYQINGHNRGQSYLNLRTEIKDQQAIKTLKPDVVFLMIGTNDVAWKNTLIDAVRTEELTSDLELLVAEIRAQSEDCILVLSSIPPVVSSASDPRAPKETIDTFNEIVRTVAAADVVNGFDTRFTDGYSAFTELTADINLLTPLPKSDGSLSPDGVHPSPSGYKKLGAHFFEALEKIYFGDFSLYTDSVDLGGGWRESPSYGYFWDNGKSHQNGWKYHGDIGWLYTAGDKTSRDLWFWKPEWGWMFTSDELYPYAYRSDEEVWYLFEEGTGFALNVDTEEREEIPAR